LGANLFNVFFNWVFIHGHLGFPAMGLTGAGLSTLLTRVVMTVVLIIYVHRAHVYRNYRVPIFSKPMGFDWKMIRNLIRIGVGTGLQYFFEVGAFSGAAVMIGWMGAEYLAAHQIALSAASFSFMFAIGISSAASIRVGKAKGERNPVEMRRAGFSAFIMAVLIMFAFGVVFVLFRFTIPRFFISDTVVIQMAGSLLIIAALFQVSDGLQSTGLGVLRGMGDVRVPTMATFASYWIIGLPGGYVLGFVLGLKVWGVWIGLLLGLTSSAIILTTRFHLKTKANIIHGLPPI
jgi:multidrug resistance protein, MATE family